MNNNLTKLLAEIKERADKATPGPWRNSPTTEYGELVWFGAEKPYGECRIAQDIGTRIDASFIAHARTDVPRLLAALEALLEQRNGALANDSKLSIREVMKIQQNGNAELEAILVALGSGRHT